MLYFYLAVAAIAPILLIAAGKRFLGSATHPAAIFILAWMLCAFLLAMAGPLAVHGGVLAFVWVTVCYSVISLIKKLRSAPKPEPPTRKEP